MNHKTKSLLLVTLLLTMMVVVGILASFGSGITGGVVADSVVCYEDAGCDDKLERTEDICRNPGTEYSICVNKPITK